VVSPIPEPATSSAFVVNLANTTQYGAAFGVNDQQQNGYTTGRLSGLDVSDQGVIFARYTNGQSKSLGQVALAAFNNTDGLSPVGDTTWVETFESGQPVIGAPDTGTLGSIKASSVEDSNVDLSAELVNLIIAQRNYQANAKTIETSDAVTQTIINLR
jgi:flagellar hook protein FlgE